MQHKGVQYEVVETANPSGWKWTVQLADDRTKTGVSCSKAHAALYAINAIELTLKRITEGEP
jgi:hypothetical protein